MSHLESANLQVLRSEDSSPTLYTHGTRRQMSRSVVKVSSLWISLTHKRYRLAPQIRWPAQLVDGLLAYCFLLYPPSDALHQAISPSKVIFSGDSSGVIISILYADCEGAIVLSTLMAIQSAQLASVPLPAGIITLSGFLDSSFSFGMEGPQSVWDSTLSPRDDFPGFKPSPAIPRLLLETAHPFLPSMNVAMHPLASPILCPDEMFKAFPPMLMLINDGEYIYKEFSMAPFSLAYNSVLRWTSAHEWSYGAGIHS